MHVYVCAHMHVHVQTPETVNVITRQTGINYFLAYTIGICIENSSKNCIHSVIK
jgi:hypothetical protein